MEQTDIPGNVRDVYWQCCRASGTRAGSGAVRYRVAPAISPEHAYGRLRFKAKFPAVPAEQCLSWSDRRGEHEFRAWPIGKLSGRKFVSIPMAETEGSGTRICQSLE